MAQYSLPAGCNTPTGRCWIYLLAAMNQKGFMQYHLKRSRRARRLRVAVYFDWRVGVTAPQTLGQNAIEQFLAAKQEWITRTQRRFARRPRIVLPVVGDYSDNKDEALRFAQSKVLQWNRIYGYSHKRISIRNQKTRWGSCSRKGNLNFNYKIRFLPERMTDYLVVHELCHLQEFNHSPRFWQMVATALPDHKYLRKQFRALVDAK